jgi:large subunit ribosomal protein L21
MYAVIKAGGKQHKVQAGDVIEVEKVVGADETLTFTPLLVVDDDGTTHAGSAVAKATVTAKAVGETKGDKVKVVKYRPKTGYARKNGHRQQYSLIEIEGVSLG